MLLFLCLMCWMSIRRCLVFCWGSIWFCVLLLMVMRFGGFILFVWCWWKVVYGLVLRRLLVVCFWIGWVSNWFLVMWLMLCCWWEIFLYFLIVCRKGILWVLLWVVELCCLLVLLRWCLWLSCNCFLFCFMVIGFWVWLCFGKSLKILRMSILSVLVLFIFLVVSSRILIFLMVVWLRRSVINFLIIGLMFFLLMWFLFVGFRIWCWVL